MSTRDTYRWYLVTSPEYDYVEVVIPETGQGPRMTTRDVAVVNARDASEAKWEAARLWEKHGGVDSWPRLMRGEHRHPLSGVTVTRWADLDPLLVCEDEDEPSERSWRPFYADLSREAADAINPPIPPTCEHCGIRLVWRPA